MSPKNVQNSDIKKKQKKNDILVCKFETSYTLVKILSENISLIMIAVISIIIG